jgi:hypothetical protein
MVNEFHDHLVLGLTNESSEGNVAVHKEFLAIAYYLAKVRLMTKLRKDTSGF